MPRFTLIPVSIALLFLLATVSACGRHSSPTGVAPGAAVATEPSRAATALIGPDGGQLSAVSSTGTQYVLEIPEGALAAPVAITMTPVSGIRDLPLTGVLGGAVVLEPSGLVFARGALLRVGNLPVAGAGERLAGFSGSSDADSFFIAPIGLGAGEVGVVVQHFSIAGFGTTAHLGSFTQASPGSMQSAYDSLYGLSLPEDRARAIEIARDVFAQSILPALQSAGDDGELLTAIAIYDEWRTVIDMIDQGTLLPPIVSITPPQQPPAHATIPELQNEITQAVEEAAFRLLLAVGGNDDACEQNASLIALSNVFFWHRQAEIIGVADVAHGLDLGTLLQGLCARVELVQQTLPPFLQVGFPQSLDLTFGVRFGNGQLRASPFQVSLTGTHVLLQNPNGATDAAGFYTTVVTASNSGPIEIDAHVCLILPGRTGPSPVCADFQITGSSTDPPVGVDLSGDYSFQLGGTQCSAVGGSSGSMTLNQNGNAINGSWSTSHMCSVNLFMTGTVTGTLSTSDGSVELVGFALEIDSITNQNGDPVDICLQHWSPYAAPSPMLVQFIPDAVFGGGMLNQLSCGGTGAGEVNLTLNAVRVAGP